ncbi:MAG: hypothetical protein ILA06_10390 [Bacteroidaceae bacterium]|nr:hypothetical protein [Bacteroidaceae bacterium]
MNRLIVLAAAACLSLSVFAQKRKAAKTPAVPAMELARQAMASYDFDRAEEALNKEIAALKRKKQSTLHAEDLLHAAIQGRSKLHATERIVIIDSLVCAADDALQAIRVSRENGRIDTYASTYHTTDSLGATLYENELANKRYLAVATPPTPEDSIASLHLAVSDKIGEQWSTPVALTGLNDDDRSQNFPFLLSDGITLYYAATGPESIGGYDIFVSRADGEDGSFLSPENVGFPFNSTANDYLLVIDEFNQLGWFVTDRRQPEGQVCVYTFIPNATREVYGDDVTEEELRSRARISAISDTWSLTDENEMNAARQRLADLREGKRENKTVRPDFQFVIDNQRTYARLDDFKSKTARSKMQQWLQLSKNSETDATMLQRMRDNYATASAAQRVQLRQTILQLEQNNETQRQQLRQLEKDIRNAEISNQ